MLRGGHVTLNADDDGDEILARARADKWLEASVSLGSRRFFLMDGDWFEIGADYVRASREAISRLFPATPSLDLPPWYLPKGRTEYDYNSDAAVRRKGYLCLDRNASVRDPLGARSSLEICDLLGPDNELIHVKRAKGSAPLSHLFSQGLVSAQSLVAGPALGPGTLRRHGRRPARRAHPPGRLQAGEGRLRHPDGERQAAHPRHAVPVLPGHPRSRRQDPRHLRHRRRGHRPSRPHDHVGHACYAREWR